MCILTYSVSKYTPSTLPSSPTAKRLKKTTAASTLASYTDKGLSVEAYRLSDQAGRLINKKTLTSIPPTAYISKLKRQIQLETKKSSKPLKSRGIDKSADTTNNNANTIELYLNDDIILKTKETNIIDPYLITIPLSIIQTNPLLKKGQNYDRFIDIFPSLNEIKHSYDKNKRILINKLIIELFKKMESPTAFTNNNTNTNNNSDNSNNSNSFKDKLRDIHLLLYICEYLDTDTINDIIRCILTNTAATSNSGSSSGSSNNKLSARSIMTLQMIRPTLTLSDADEEEEEEEL